VDSSRNTCCQPRLRRPSAVLCKLPCPARSPLFVCVLLTVNAQKENGGPLDVELVEFEAGRGNVLTYPGNGKSGKYVSFVGSCARGSDGLGATTFQVDH
jgi:hypothetical protein